MFKLLRFVYLLILLSTARQIIQSSSSCITFHGSPFSPHLPENSAGGSIILSINISGYDANNPVTFTLSNFGHLFDVRAYSQHTQLEISVRADADINREVSAYYEFDIEAAQYNTMCALAEVTLVIEDECDVVPEFTSLLKISLPENSPVNVSLYTFTAEDGDLNQAIKFTIDDPTNTFTIGAYSGELSLTNSLDCEQIKSYSLLVTVSDNCQPSLSTSQYFIINVTNVNDEIPEFLQDCCSHSVPENSPNGTVIGIVSARDGDICHIVESLTWSIQSSNAEEPFRINPNTGQLIVNNPDLLNRETTSNYSIFIIVYEGDQGNFATSSVFIEITDVNDNPPEFVSSNITISLIEGAISGTLLFQLNATDADLEGSINSQISYAILPEGDTNNTFSIDGPTGIVSCNRLLDREIYSDPFMLVFIAYDYGYPSLTSTAYVEFTLIDANDNPPQFNATLYTISVVENNVNTILTTITATDADIDDNARISYMLTENPNNHFRLDSIYGILSTSSVIIDREETRNFTLTIMATDGGTPSLFSTTEVLVIVIDVNDNTPEFSQSSYVFTILEELPPEQVTFSILAVDLDDPMTNNGRVLYVIISGDMGGNFYLNGSYLLTTVTFNREIMDSYNLTIQAMDAGTPSKSATVLVTITITDINDNSPQFTRVTYIVGFSQDAEFATEIVHIQATDADLPPYNTIVYGLTDSLQDFSFMPSNGKLYTNRLFKDSSRKSFTFTVTAYDNSNTSPTNSNSTSLVVVVLNREDRMSLVVGESVSSVGAKLGSIRLVLEEITGAIINIEFIKPRGSAITCLPSSDDVDTSHTEIVFNAFNRLTGEVISPDMLIKSLDENSDDLLYTFEKYSFQSVTECPVAQESVLFPILISLVSLLGVCLIFTCCVLCCIIICVRLLQRRAARKQEDRVPFFPSMSTLSTLTSSSAFNRSDILVTDNPLFRHPYDDLVSQSSSMPTPGYEYHHYLPDYETQELIIDLFTHDDMDNYIPDSISNVNVYGDDKSDAITSLISSSESTINTEEAFTNEDSYHEPGKSRPDSFELIRAAIDSYEDYISDSSDAEKSVI